MQVGKWSFWVSLSILGEERERETEEMTDWQQGG